MSQQLGRLYAHHQDKNATESNANIDLPRNEIYLRNFQGYSQPPLAIE
jgi:hypothetical protein